MVNSRTAELSKGQAAASGPTSSASSRSDSSKSPTSPDGIDFRFLNFSHPKDAKNAQTRRNVRSHVTSKQHEKHRQRVAEQARQSQQNSQQPSPTSCVRLSRASAETSPTHSNSEPEASSPEASAPTSPSVSTHRINPLEVYPESWHTSLRPVMDHYCNSMAVDLPETDAATRQAIRTQLVALILTDPASLHALMLVATAHLAKLHGDNSHNIDVLQLRGMAIQEVNRAMTGHGAQGRATSDSMIVAVGKMATFELLFGHREIFHTHMTGLQRMVSLRGGLPALGFGGVLERSLLWIDANAAEITGGALYFPPAVFASSSSHPRADRRLFLMGLQTQA
ncbi:hypothetical protein CBER1_04963 [Cercospora berteroae]|uniref:Uncharacterized protein n=1 Tax=Cercospora berteroae TaxID=357750 RepID=A0A2S6CJJ9_9PEZI|nr:hypothetical protein CBER1_04963 [Cercospora berteroae]